MYGICEICMHGRYVTNRMFDAADQLLSCPYTHPHTDIQPTVESMLVTWMNHAMLGQPLGDDWEATEGGFLDNKSGANTQ